MANPKLIAFINSQAELEALLDDYSLDEIQELYKNDAFNSKTRSKLRAYISQRVKKQMTGSAE